MEIIGYIGAMLMGLSLGLIGGGGSILTVPILVYLFSVDAVLATAYSLFIVGLTSLIGIVQPHALGQHPLAHGPGVRRPEHPGGVRHAGLAGARASRPALQHWAARR